MSSTYRELKEVLEKMPEEMLDKKIKIFDPEDKKYFQLTSFDILGIGDCDEISLTIGDVK
jgi:hypothetical protein